MSVDITLNLLGSLFNELIKARIMELQVWSKASSIIVGDLLIKHVDDDLKSLKPQPTRKRVLPLPVKSVATPSVKKKQPELSTGSNYKALEMLKSMLQSIIS